MIMVTALSEIVILILLGLTSALDFSDTPHVFTIDEGDYIDWHPFTETVDIYLQQGNSEKQIARSVSDYIYWSATDVAPGSDYVLAMATYGTDRSTVYQFSITIVEASPITSSSEFEPTASSGSKVSSLLTPSVAPNSTTPAVTPAPTAPAQSDPTTSAEPASEKDGLSKGGKAGVAVGTIVGVAALAGVAFLVWNHLQKKKEDQPMSEVTQYDELVTERH